MHKEIKALREQAQPILTKLQTGETVTPQEFEDAKAMYELAYYLRKFDDVAEPDEDGYIYHIKDELDGSNEYYKMWMEESDPALKDMAAQELKHSEWWIRKARESGEVSEADLQECITYHNAMMAKLA